MTELDTARTQPVVDNLLNAAHRISQRRSSIELLNLPRPRSRKGGYENRSYDFGTLYSVPAVVIDGKVVRSDGKPHR